MQPSYKPLSASHHAIGHSLQASPVLGGGLVSGYSPIVDPRHQVFPTRRSPLNSHVEVAPPQALEARPVSQTTNASLAAIRSHDMSSSARRVPTPPTTNSWIPVTPRSTVGSSSDIHSRRTSPQGVNSVPTPPRCAVSSTASATRAHAGHNEQHSPPRHVSSMNPTRHPQHSPRSFGGSPRDSAGAFGAAAFSPQHRVGQQSDLRTRGSSPASAGPSHSSPAIPLSSLSSLSNRAGFTSSIVAPSDPPGREGLVLKAMPCKASVATSGNGKNAGSRGEGGRSDASRGSRSRDGSSSARGASTRPGSQQTRTGGHQSPRAQLGQTTPRVGTTRRTGPSPNGMPASAAAAVAVAASVAAANAASAHRRNGAGNGRNTGSAERDTQATPRSADRITATALIGKPTPRFDAFRNGATLPAVPEPAGGSFEASEISISQCVPNEIADECDRHFPSTSTFAGALPRPQRPDCSVAALPEPPPFPPELRHSVESSRAAALEARLRETERELQEEKARRVALESKLAASQSLTPRESPPPILMTTELMEGAQEVHRPYSQPTAQHTSFASNGHRAHAIVPRSESEEAPGDVPPSPQIRPPLGTWSNGMFGAKQQAPRELVVQQLAENLREGFQGLLQGGPCCLGAEAIEQDSVNSQHREELRHSIGELCIAEVASPQRHRRRPSAWSSSKGTLTCVGAKKVDNGAPPLAALAQASASLYKEAFTFSENPPSASDAAPSAAPLSARPSATSKCIMGGAISAAPETVASGGASKNKSPDSQTHSSCHINIRPSNGRLQATPQTQVPKGDMHPAISGSERPVHTASGIVRRPSFEHSPEKHPANSHGSTRSSPSQVPASIESPIPAVTHCEAHSTAFMDDVKLRADALRHRSKHGRSGLIREKCDLQMEEGSGATCPPYPSKGSPSKDVPWTSPGDFDSPSGDQVIVDLTDILQGFPADGSALGNSLDDSMMGGSVDESLHNGITMPDLPEPRLGECKLAGAEALPQPQRTVFFPAPPVNSSPVVYHAGHHKGWSQRACPSGAVPQAFEGL